MGDLEFHSVSYYNTDDEWVHDIYLAKGEAECDFSEETFYYSEKGKYSAEGTAGFVVHLKGDQGSKIMMHIAIDIATWEWTFGPANCK